MRSILSLVQNLGLVYARRNEYDAFKILDENVKHLADKIEKLEAKNLKYFCSVGSGTLQVIPAAVGLTVAFELTNYPQFGNMHDNVRNNTNIYIRRSGVYNVAAGAQYEGDAAVGTIRVLYLVVVRNGVALSIAYDIKPALAVVITSSISLPVYLYEGDVIQMFLFHNGAGPLDMQVNATEHMPYLVVSERMEDLSPDQYGLLDPNANMR